MIDHVSLKVADVARARAFYAKALAPLGYKVMMEFPQAIGLGDTKPDLWLVLAERTAPTHLAFAASRPAIDAFHAAALAAGGTDNGTPGLRTHYHPNYYGAFVLDPEGNNVEAVCHAPPVAAKKPAAKRKPAAKKPARKPKRRR